MSRQAIGSRAIIATEIPKGDLFLLVFSAKCQENNPKAKDFFSQTNPKILGSKKQGKRSKNKDLLITRTKSNSTPRKQGRENQGERNAAIVCRIRLIRSAAILQSAVGSFHSEELFQRSLVYPYVNFLSSRDETQTMVGAKLRPKLRPPQTLLSLGKGKLRPWSEFLGEQSR